MIYTYSPNGSLGAPVCVEVDARSGIPGIDIVGLPGVSVREARERIRFSLENSCIPLKQRRILINLSPADLPKKGSGFDLPMAIALIESQGVNLFPDTMVLGELSLSGDVLPVVGESAAFVQGLAKGIQRFLFPKATKEELPNIPGALVARAENLLEAMDIMVKDKFEPLENQQESTNPPKDKPMVREQRQENRHSVEGETIINPSQALYLWDDVHITEEGERAVSAFLGGRHSMLLVGPPGSGKSFLASAIRELRGNLDFSGQLEVATIWSQAGQPCTQVFQNAKVPWRQPHHSATREGLIGGGKMLLPGEMSLAHLGILFLDECLEFSSHFLQNLRQPLEDGVIRHSRAGKTHTMPANFQLLLACNPCPCGFLGSTQHNCVCSAQEVQRYWNRLNGPLLDRIDIKLWMDGSTSRKPSKSSHQLRALSSRVMQRKNEDKKTSRDLVSHMAQENPLGRGLSRRGLRSVGSLAKTLAYFDSLPFPDQGLFHQAVELRQGITNRLSWL